jgi:quercetin dioxygenase-like cupin family protein
MQVHRWHEEPVEELSPTIGRQLVHTETMTVARVFLRKGAVVPEHSHVSEQVVNVMEGKMRFGVDGEEHVVAGGETLVLPPNMPHEAEALEDSVVLDVFSPTRDDWQRGEDAYLRG